MSAIKRKSSGDSKRQSDGTGHKKAKLATREAASLTKSQKSLPSVKRSSKIQAKREEAKKAYGSDELVESDTTESHNGFDGFSNSEGDDKTANPRCDSTGNAGGISPNLKTNPHGEDKTNKKVQQNGQSSREAHAKQKALTKERKLAKPNADTIQRSKKLWERLRRKSHVPKQEREQLVTELYDIVTGRVKDFVFKHDSVRVVQCALKYANMQQRKTIARELKGEYKTLAESRYAKFLIGKILVEGDAEVRDLIVPEFYGHVRRMINHPEASWIIDDVYRQIATKDQKALMLREWYGAEFSIFKNANAHSTEKITAELSTILTLTPEKRKPIMSYLFQMINQLIQKRMTGFTMLHDAMLQYYLNISPTSEEYLAFTDLLRPDSNDESDGTPDLLKNLAFTASGSQLTCLFLAHTNAKDRRALLKVFKDTIQIMAHDPHAHTILLTAYTVIDDTREVAKTIFPPLLSVSKLSDLPPPSEAVATTASLALHPAARRTLLYPLLGPAKALLSTPQLRSQIEDVRTASQDSSKKDTATRQAELARAVLPHLLATVTNHAADLVSSGPGAQFIADVLLCPHSDLAERRRAAEVVARLASGDPTAEDHAISDGKPWAGRMLGVLVRGGKFDAEKGEVARSEGWPEVGFPQLAWAQVKGYLMAWATGGSSFVVVNLMEVEEKDGGLEETERLDLIKRLQGGKVKLEEVVQAKGNVGARMVLEKLK